MHCARCVPSHLDLVGLVLAFTACSTSPMENGSPTPPSGPVPTTTTLPSNTNPSVLRQSVAFTATVSAAVPGSRRPNGGVTFKDGGVDIASCTSQALSDGAATCVLSSLRVATHSITAAYAGDADFTASTSKAVRQVVNRAGTSVTLVSSANPVVAGQSVTLTATVSPNLPIGIPFGTPTGTVTFQDAGVGIANCTARPVLGDSDSSVSRATCVIVGLPVASPDFTANYSGDSAFAASMSGDISELVNRAPTSVVLSSSANPSAYGQAVTISANVSGTVPGSIAPTGTVTFYAAGQSQLFHRPPPYARCNLQVLSTGVASCGMVLSQLAVTNMDGPKGQNSFIATYNGDANFSPDVSNSMTQMVNKAPTTVMLASNANPSVFGQFVTFTATVSPNPRDVFSGAGIDGTVTFMDGGAAICSPLPAGATATCAINSLIVGTHLITASFSGNRNFAPASNTVNEVVK